MKSSEQNIELLKKYACITHNTRHSTENDTHYLILTHALSTNNFKHPIAISYIGDHLFPIARYPRLSLYCTEINYGLRCIKMQALAGAQATVKSEVLEGEEAQTALQQRWYEIKSLIS